MTIQNTLAQSESSDILAIKSKLQDGSLGMNYYVGLLGLRTFDTAGLLKLIERGLAFKTFTRLQHNIKLSQDQLGEIVNITPRTLVRRKKAGRLEPVESDRLLRTSRIFGNALQLFEGDAAAARAWLQSPVRGLGNVTPLMACRTEFGANEVDRLIGQMEHGVFT